MKKPTHVWAVDAAPTTLDYALAYARLGWAVLPVWGVNAEGECRCGRANSEPGHSAGKHPHARLAPNGHHNATTDEELLRSWWAHDPECGIGISLAESGLLALDIDPRNGGDETLAKLQSEHGVLHSDLVAVTQGGGEHRLFRAEPNMVYPATLGPGLDLKHHGYICVAPTLGPLGEYSWAAGASPLSKSRPTEPSPLPAYIASKARPAASYHLTERAGVPVATAQTFDDLRSALKHIDADDYHTWVQVGLVLKPYGENGYRVWTEWAAGSAKFDAAVARRKWDRDLTEPHSITYRSIFRMAIDNGWAGNTPPATAPGERHPLSLKNAQPSGAGAVTMFEYAFDDFMSTGINVVAGAPGVGKTTLIIPLAAAAAHLCPVDYVLRPAIRRNVIIVTESVVQVQRVIYSLYTWGYTGCSREAFDSHIRVIPARRLNPKYIAQVAEEYRCWTHPNPTRDGGDYAALPLVVFDTANSVFDMENENDNAEVGRALAIIKEQFVGFPVVIIAHTPKLTGTSELDAFGPRGASAWTADAQGVYTVFRDGDHPDSPRVLKATKVRFPTRWAELTFDLVTNRQPHRDVLGNEVDVWFSHSVARPLGSGERAQLKEDLKEEREQEAFAKLKLDLLLLVQARPGHARSFYEQMPRAAGGVSGAQTRKEKAMSELLDSGALLRIELPNPKGRATHQIVPAEGNQAGNQVGT